MVFIYSRQILIPFCYIIWANIAQLFCCEAPEMCPTLWNFTQLFIGFRFFFFPCMNHFRHTKYNIYVCLIYSMCGGDL